MNLLGPKDDLRVLYNNGNILSLLYGRSGGLLPTLLVFGELPSPIHKRPSPNKIEFEEIIQDAMSAAANEKEIIPIVFGLELQKGPKAV